MLEEYKSIYQNEADKIPNWKTINKNQLCRLFVEEPSKERKNSYFSAIVCNYWHLIPKYYNMSQNIATVEDVYNWVIDTIVYVLDNHVWTDPKSSLYKDVNGPDKAINKNLSCRRYTAYQAFNRQKRKPSYLNVSWEEIADRCEIDTLTEEFMEPQDLDINNLIRNCFVKKQYMTAFIIDNIAYGDTFSLYSETKEGKKSKQDEDSEAFKNESGYVVFNKLWLEKRLKKLSPADAQYFANRYDLPLEVVEDKLINYLAKASNKDIKNLIKNTLDDLKNNFQEFEILDANRFYEFG